MTKFKVGDRVRVIKSGWGVHPKDIGKEAIVTGVGLNYIFPGDGILIKTIGSWYCWTYTCGEESFELFELKEKRPPRVYGIVRFTEKWYGKPSRNG